MINHFIHEPAQTDPTKHFLEKNLYNILIISIIIILIYEVYLGEIN